MASHQLVHIKIDDLDIIGYSVAGEETVVACPQLKVCFDIGKAPDQVISIPNVLLTHGHMDHAAGIVYYLSHRNFDGQVPGTVLLPKNLLPHLEQILAGWSRLDGNHIPSNLVGVEAGDEFQIKPNLFARVFANNHVKGSVGYTVVERRNKLKPEYRQLRGPQIVELKKQGIRVDYRLEIPIVTYLGDTQLGDFMDLDYVAHSKILITECTFFDMEHLPRAQAGKHLHVSDLAHLVESMDNEHVILTHATERTGIRQIKRCLEEALSEEALEKIRILMDRKPQLRRQKV